MAIKIGKTVYRNIQEQVEKNKEDIEGIKKTIPYPSDEYYNKDSENKGIAEIIVAKQRNGPIGTVNLVWLPEYTRFANLERQSGPRP